MSRPLAGRASTSVGCRAPASLALSAAAGYYGEASDSFPSPEELGPDRWIEASGIGQLRTSMFVAKVTGYSMEPRIHDGDYCVFETEQTGTPQGKIVLARLIGFEDPATGSEFTVKKYLSGKAVGERDTESRRANISLKPLNPLYKTIMVGPDQDQSISVIGVLVAILGGE